MKRKLFLLLVLLSILMIGIFVGAKAEIITGEATATLGGSKNITYTLDTDTGIMTISGSGGWDDYHWFYATSFSAYNATIKKVIISEGVTSVAGKAFSGCQNLTSVQFASTVTRIGYDAFKNCVSLRSITLPEGLVTISSSAFNGCSAMTQANIPSTVTSIGESAFEGATALKGEFVTYGDLDNWAFYNCGFTSIDVRNCTSMGTGVFKKSPNLKTVKLCEGIQTIPVDFVASCPLLSTVNIPASTNAIEDTAFYACENLKSITLPEGLISIKASAFSETSLSSITLPSTLTTLGTSVFSKCTSLRSANIPAKCETIPQSTFSNCSNLREVTIDEGIYQIAKYAFDNCTALKSIDLPKSLETIADHAFENCKMLKQADIPNNVEVIGESAFYFCEALTSVKIPEGITTINASTFAGAGLTTVELPKSLVSVKKNAFASNPITKVIYPGTKEDWAELNIDTGNDPLIDGYEVRVESVTLDQENAVLYRTTDQMHPEMQLTATVLPENAWTTAVTWESSDPDVATVNETGKVTVVDKGSCTIYCKSEDKSNQTGYCYLTVADQGITGITLGCEKKTLYRKTDDENPTFQVEYTVEPENAILKDVIWESSDWSIAQIDENGIVTGCNEGECKIYCRAVNNDGYYSNYDENIEAVCTITVANQPVESIKLKKKTVTLYRTSKNAYPTAKLKATVSPSNAWNKYLEWRSSKKSVVSVWNGEITGNKKGTATITCKATDGSGVFVTCKVVVKDRLVTKLELNKTKATLKKGKTLTLKVKTVTPSDAFNKKVTWKSSDKKIATVDSKGKVTAKKKGKCKIICTAADGSKVKVICQITVK